MTNSKKNFRIRLVAHCALVSVFLSFSTYSYAKMYEYTDANGKTHYTNSLPPQKSQNIIESKEKIENQEIKALRLEVESRDRDDKNEAEKRANRRKREKKAREARLQEKYDKIDRESKYGRVLRRKKATNGTRERFGYTKASTLACNTHLDYVIRSSIHCRSVGSVKVLWVSDYIEKNPKGNTVKFQYWSDGAKGFSSNKLYGYTALTNIQ